MLNNKGFAVSTILYTILIAFLLFLGITLSMFSSSNSIISNANNDLVNGTVFRAVQVKDNNKEGVCGQDYAWFEMDNNILIKINSRYGIVYWPRDFVKNNVDFNLNDGEISSGTLNSVYNKIGFEIKLIDGTLVDIESNSINLKNEFEIIFTDIKNDNYTTTLTVGDICG